MKRIPLGLSLGLALLALARTSPAQSPIEGLLQAQSATPPQEATAVVIEDICPQGQNNLATLVLDQDLNDRCDEIVVGALGGSDVPGAQDGLQAMAPEEDSVIQASQADTNGTPMQAIGDRQATIRAGAAGDTSFALRLDGRSIGRSELLASDASLAGRAAGDASGLGGWGFFLDGGFVTADKDATRRESGFEVDGFQLTAGADRQLSSHFLLGAAVGYTSLGADVDNDGGEVDMDGYSVFGYASYFPSDALYVDAVVGYAANDMDQERAIRYSIAALGGGTTNVNQTAFSDTESDEFSARMTLGYQFFTEAWSWGPYARIEYATVEIDGFRETIPTGGAGSGLAVEIDEQDFTSVPLALGLQASTTMETGSAALQPYAFFEYVHEFKNDREDITGRFLGDPSRTTFFLPTDSPDRNLFNLGLGVSALFDDGWSGHVAYQTLLGHKDLSIHAFEVGVRLQF